MSLPAKSHVSDEESDLLDNFENVQSHLAADYPGLPNVHAQRMHEEDGETVFSDVAKGSSVNPEQQRKHLKSERIRSNHSSLASDTELRRSQRERKTTEKGKQLKEERVKHLSQRFYNSYDKWKNFARQMKETLRKGDDYENLINDLGHLKKISKNITEIYEDIRRNCTPQTELRRKTDTCEAVTSKISEAVSKLESQHKQTQFGRFESIFSSVKSSTSRSTKSSRLSKGSSKRLEASAELAVSKAKLKALEIEEQKRAELAELELKIKERQVKQETEAKQRQLERESEEARIKVESDLENIKMQQALEERRQNLKQIEAMNRVKIAESKIKAYESDEHEEESLNEETEDFLSIYNNREENLEREKHIPHEREKHIPHEREREKHISYEKSENPSTTNRESRQNDLDNMTTFFRTLTESMNLNRLPIPEPTIFYGDPIKYADWRASFNTLIDSKNIPATEKIFYLKRYVGGPAKKTIEGYFLLNTESAYYTAWSVLDERYGNPFTVAKAFREKLHLWPKISSKDSSGLREFADFLKGCESAMSHVKGLEILNDCHENQKILCKLPDWLTSRWNRKVVEIEEFSGGFPNFNQFVDFITKEAKIACNPVTSLQALKNSDSTSVQPRTASRTNKANTMTIGTSEQSVNNRNDFKKLFCVLCKKEGHNLHKCKIFSGKTLTEKQQFVQQNNLCFGCLKKGHRSKDCRRKSICEKCRGRHPSVLHSDSRKPSPVQHKASQSSQTDEVDAGNRIETHSSTSCRVLRQDVTNSSTIVPVWISTVDKPDNEILIYTLLDTQSDSTFILKDTSDALNVQSEEVKLKLSTMTAKHTIIQSSRISGLQVRGFNSDLRISLPPTYTREFIPADRSHIPTNETAKKWSHLQQISDELPPIQSCEVGLLIGYNCPQALLPREILAGDEDNQPFAQRTDLGWSVVGCVSSQLVQGSRYVNGLSHRITVKEIPALTPNDIVRILESDFVETKYEDKSISQEDIQFLKILDENIHKTESDHYEMPLPFKEKHPDLPNNKALAVSRLNYLKKKLRNDPKYYKDYTAFMTEITDRGDAEKVKNTASKDVTWYIPHHGVYHSKKPDKIRVVFDCSAKFEGVSLNDCLLSGPDLTNGLLGVLCRFRKYPCAVMCDIEKMFHQFYVNKEDRDYLRFLWWEKGDLDTEPIEYRMTVHLFGATSSPGCANFGFKHTASNMEDKYPLGASFIKHNFYVDDGLTSLQTVEEVIKLIQEARDICVSGGLRLHKFVSNNKEITESIPPSERAKNVNTFDLNFENLSIERALGIQWCVETDTFQFRIILKDQPLTRRGILSTVASIYDPLGFLAPFVLIGKQILQEMCRRGIAWDDPLPDELRPRWECWRSELPKLTQLHVPRCYQPVGFGCIKECELHHFSDASSTGYGQCSYLRLLDDSNKVHCSFIIGKSRVAPTKVITMPRLELTAAVVSVKMSNLLQNELEYENLQEYFWTDSKVVLGYLNNEARRFHIFVANRVQRIRQSTKPDQWNYIESEQNPADHASRGMNVCDLINSTWFSGPNFLQETNFKRSDTHIIPKLDLSDPEVKITKVLTTSVSNEFCLLDR